MRNRLLGAVLAGALALAVAPPTVADAATPAGTAAAGPGYQEYVALGDSWTADVFTRLPSTRFVPLDCAQSPSDYPHQVAEALGVPRFRDASCGSATSAHLTRPQDDLPLGGVNPPQFDRLRRTTDLVTVGIGGNDIGLAGAVTGCLNVLPVDLGLPAPLGRACSKGFTAGGRDVFQQRIRRTEPRLARALREIHRRSPRADIFLVNYLNGLPVDGKGCWPIVPIGNADMAYLQKTFLSLNAMLARVARADPHTRLVDTYRPTLGHDVCKAPGRAYVAGLIPAAIDNPLLLAFPFHPTRRGADAQARIVLRVIRR